MFQVSEYAVSLSPCCDESGHRPAGSEGVLYFCMQCGDTYPDKH